MQPKNYAIKSKICSDKGHLIIGGTGRAGTTFLVQFFTALGFDTGFSLDYAINSVDPLSNAGLEHRLYETSLPYVVKSPWISEDIEEAILKNHIKIQAAIIPMRNLLEAAASRRRVFNVAKKQGLDPWTHPGSLWKTKNPEEQESCLAMEFYRFLWPLVAHEIPVFLLHFPRLINDPEYLYGVINPIMAAHGVEKTDMLSAHAKVAISKFVHNFHIPGSDRSSS